LQQSDKPLNLIGASPSGETNLRNVASALDVKNDGTGRNFFPVAPADREAAATTDHLRGAEV